nr:DUF922 domain-containing protein [Rhizobium sp. CG5]
MALSPWAAQADWQAVEKVQPYVIEGSTGAELYASIGERGPKLGMARVIAHTTFTLTWTRKYEPQPGGACVLTTARPKLTILYTLPKPAKKLQGAVASLWETFITGVRDHEKVHGEYIKDLVKAIETTSLGLTVADDPDCSKIRTELTSRLGKLSQEQRQRSRDFDKVELSDGGNIHQLVLMLVNQK